MRVVNYCSNDWANFSHHNANALRSIGVDCVDYVSEQHPYNYPSCSPVVEPHKIKQAMKEADFVQVFHSNERGLRYYLDSGTKAKLIVYHAGSKYRRDPEYINLLFNPHVHRSVLALPEFVGLGAKNEIYQVGCVNVSEFDGYMKKTKGARSVYHFPSSPEKKGTAEIVSMMQEIKALHSFKHGLGGDNYEAHKAKLRGCDIYVELFKPELEGKTYGSFGMQALESAAMGQAVVTQNLHKDVYTNTYGDCKLVLPEDRNDFIMCLNVLLWMGDKELQELKEETRAWVEYNHSYKATGNDLIDRILK